MNKGLIYSLGGVSLALLFGGVILFFRNKKSQSEKETEKENTPSSSTKSNTKLTTTAKDIDILSKNLGLKASSNGSITTPFNNKKNTIQFYSNGRFSVNDSATKKLIKKGSWTDGGTKLTPDGGKLISSGSVWTNISKLV